MSTLVKKNASFFRLLSTTPSKLQRNALLDSITEDQLRALVEITVNFLRGVLVISPKRKGELGKYKTLIRTIGDRSVGLKKKRKLVRGRGIAIALLLKAVEPSLKAYLS